jgi:O-methyltransferase
MSESLFEKLRNFYWKYPKLRPPMTLIHSTFFIKPLFRGWGMTTEAVLPWDDEFQGKTFRVTHQDAKKSFRFSKDTTGTTSKKLDGLMWRHWIVSYCINFIFKFAKTDFYNFVECGVGEGLTAFYALHEIKANTEKAKMYLYDSWDAMKSEDLLPSESHYEGRYKNLELDTTKQNLSKFQDILVYHKGYIPSSFTVSESPDSIVYLSIDLNSAKPTLATLEYFFPKLLPGGIILFDDYGQIGYSDTRKIIDKFFHDKPGILMKLPTSQAIYYR